MSENMQWPRQLVGMDAHTRKLALCLAKWNYGSDPKRQKSFPYVALADMERFYLADLPLHHSQRSVERGEDYEDFELRLRPTDDFCRHLLSHGGSLQVLSPPSLVEHVRKMLHDALKRYE